ncbi:MAG: hypothetical protein IIZ60_00385 [Clostridia bacterium]|nr:hypothetical protein [Clostridia bacterium]
MVKLNKNNRCQLSTQMYKIILPANQNKTPPNENHRPTALPPKKLIDQPPTEQNKTQPNKPTVRKTFRQNAPPTKAKPRRPIGGVSSLLLTRFHIQRFSFKRLHFPRFSFKRLLTSQAEVFCGVQGC